MASAVIHMAVANEINKVIKRDTNQLLVGSVAPDISKVVGESRNLSHFIDNDNSSIPNINRFLDKYKNRLNDDFVLGYFIHLYTDYLWFKYFMTEIYEDRMITKLDGTYVKCTGNMVSIYIYNDYSNLNEQLIDDYKLDLTTFYSNSLKFENIIEEIPMDKIKVIMDKTLSIIEESKVHKDYIFNIKNIKKFISLSTDLILSKLEELEIM